MSQYNLAPSQPQKSTGSGCIMRTLAVIGAITVVIVALVIINGLFRVRRTNTILTTSKRYNVVYEVNVVGRDDASRRIMDLTYTNATGNTEQSTEFIPWRHEFVAAPGQFVSVSAQNGRDYISFECKIKVDGITVEEAGSSGPHKIASCSGSVR